jgi:hypothetical protein
MDSPSLISEQKSAKTMQERDFNSLNRKNRPLPLDDDRFVPDSLKMADKELKMSGSNRSKNSIFSC